MQYLEYKDKKVQSIWYQWSQK